MCVGVGGWRVWVRERCVVRLREVGEERVGVSGVRRTVTRAYVARGGTLDHSTRVQYEYSMSIVRVVYEHSMTAA
jgi:hypothetical protein